MNTHNEETLLDAHANPNETKQETVNTPQPEVKKDVPANKGKNIFKKVAVGAAGVAVAGGAAMALMAFKEPDEPVNPAPNTPHQPIAEPVEFDGANVPMAHNVTEDMNFSDAFAAAREEVGPGGVFQWHGGTYGTYYANEWQSLSPDYQHAFSNYPYVFEIDDETAPIHPVPDQVVHHDHFGDFQIYTDEHGNQFILIPDFAGNEIRINPEHLGYVVFDEDGTIVGITHDDALYNVEYEEPVEPWMDDFSDIEIVEDDVVVLEPSDEIDDDLIIVADDPDAIVIDTEDDIEIIDPDDTIQIDDVLDTDLSDMDLMDNDMLADFDNDADISNFA